MEISTIHIEKQKKSQQEIISNTISFLRFPLCVFVVFIHSFGKPDDYNLEFMHNNFFCSYSMFNYLRICFSHVLTNIAVPVFFVISGYLFFKGMDKWNWYLFGEKLKTRVQTLLVPYILWNILALLLKKGAVIYKYIITPPSFGDLFCKVSSLEWLHFFWDSHTMKYVYYNFIGTPVVSTAPCNVPLWFVRDLFVVMLLAPIVFLAIRKLKIWFIFIIAFCYITSIWISIPGFSSNAFLFFSMGCYVRLYNFDDRKVKIITCPLFVMTLCLLLVSVYFDGKRTFGGMYIFPIYVILGTIFMLFVSYQGIKRGLLTPNLKLAKTTFFVFAAHQLILPYIKRLIYYIHIEDYYILSLRYFTIPTITIFILLSIYFFLNKYANYVLCVLLGNRSK